MTRLKKLANIDNFVEQLKMFDQGSLKKICTDKLNDILDPFEILEFAQNKEISIETLDFEEYVEGTNVIQHIWESIEDVYDIYPNDTHYNKMTEEVHDYILNLLYDINGESKFDENKESSIEEEIQNSEEDTWNQDDYI